MRRRTMVRASGGNVDTDMNLCNVILYDRNLDKLVQTSEFTRLNKNRYEPIGIVVIPTAHDVYGTGECGVMALMSASLTTPDTGQTSNEDFSWGASGTDYPELNNFTQANTLSINDESCVLGHTTYSHLPSDNDNFSGNLSLDGIAKYKYNHTQNAPSPYNADGSRNPLYFATGPVPTIEPVLGPPQPATVDGLNFNWTSQSGNWDESANPDAKDGKQFTTTGPDRGSRVIRCTFSGKPGKITFACKFVEKSYGSDYLTIGELDRTCDRSTFGTSLQGQSNKLKKLSFDIPDDGEHYVEFCYSKTYPGDTTSDYAVVYIDNGTITDVITMGQSGSGSTANALSDFAGKSNTEFLCSKATSQENWKTDDAITGSSDAGYHPAACACWRFHTVGTSQGDWYLPACGELGYVCVRYKLISETIAALQAWSGKTYCSLTTSCFWPSSEYDSRSACYVKFSDGDVGHETRRISYPVRPFLRGQFEFLPGA